MPQYFGHQASSKTLDGLTLFVNGGLSCRLHEGLLSHYSLVKVGHVGTKNECGRDQDTRLWEALYISKIPQLS
jgi:hypothetical protein